MSACFLEYLLRLPHPPVTPLPVQALSNDPVDPSWTTEQLSDAAAQVLTRGGAPPALGTMLCRCVAYKPKNRPCAAEVLDSLLATGHHMGWVEPGR